MPTGVYKRIKKIKWSEDSKRRFSESMKGKSSNALGRHWKLSEQAKINIGNGHKGLKRSEEAKKNISLGKLGKKQTPQHIESNRQARLKNPTRYWLNKHRESNSGEKHYLWKGGITPENNKIRASLEYTIWRRSVFERDNWTCQKCKQKGGNLNADHIKSFLNYPELRFNIDNGRTLCIECHKKTDTYGFKLLNNKIKL